MKQTFKELFKNKANPETVYNRYNLPKEDRAVLDKVLKQGIGGENQPIEINDGREYYCLDLDFVIQIYNSGFLPLNNQFLPLTAILLDTKYNTIVVKDREQTRTCICIEVGNDLLLDEGITLKEKIRTIEGFERQIQITRYNYFNLHDITQPVFIDFEPNNNVSSFTTSTITITNELKNRLQNTNTKRTIVAYGNDFLDILKYEKKNGIEYLTVAVYYEEPKEYICIVEAAKPEDPTYLRHTHYITNNATGGYYVEKNGEFELVEFDNATIEVKLDSDYSGNYKEGYALFNVTFPGTDENGYVKNSRPYTYIEELGLITIEGVLQGTGSYSPLTERKDINLKLTNSGRTLQLLNEHVISTTSPNVWTNGLVELQGVEI